MTDQIKDAIIALRNGDSSEFKTAINASLMDRAMDAINTQRFTAGQSVFGELEQEPEEQAPEPEVEIDDPQIEEVPDEEI